MATPAQVTANQANSRHSTGPRTLEGKARVAQNAVSHGLTARHLVIRDDEREEFAAFESSLAAELDPQGATELVTYQEILHAAWNLRRFRRLEAECSLGTIDDFTDPQTTAVLDRLTRYQARAQRAYYRALQELRTLQTNRALRRAKLDAETEAEVPAITDINNLTKQTRSEVLDEAMKQAIKLVDFDTSVLRHSAYKSTYGHSQPGAALNQPDSPAVRL